MLSIKFYKLYVSTFYTLEVMGSESTHIWLFRDQAFVNIDF